MKHAELRNMKLFSAEIQLDEEIPRKVDPLRQVVATNACTGDFLRLAKFSGGINANFQGKEQQEYREKEE